MFNLFQWLRSGVKNAVLGGIADAVDEIKAPEPTNDVLLALKAKLATPGQVEPAEEHSGNGNRIKGRLAGVKGGA